MRHVRLFFSFVFSLIFLGLTSCIHIEDVDQAPEEPLVLQTKYIGNLVVEGELFVIDGEILNKEAYEYLQSQTISLEQKKTDLETMEIAFQSLTLKKGGVLYTMGGALHLKAHRLLSEGGRIATFPPGQTAPPQKNGRGGGFVYLHVDQAEGELYISLRGENGGAGKPGAKPDIKLQGNDGVAVFGRCGEDAYVTQGERGKQGYPGESGMNGGDTGNFELMISDQEKFKYHLEKIPGQGGVGGAGGRGGEGGRTPNVCGMGRAPIPGPQGAPGPTGEAGQLGSLCLTSHGITSCS